MHACVAAKTVEDDFRIFVSFHSMFDFLQVNRSSKSCYPLGNAIAV